MFVYKLANVPIRTNYHMCSPPCQQIPMVNSLKMVTSLQQDEWTHTQDNTLQVVKLSVPLWHPLSALSRRRKSRSHGFRLATHITLRDLV
jgi:hypothetical protein